MYEIVAILSRLQATKSLTISGYLEPLPDVRAMDDIGRAESAEITAALSLRAGWFARKLWGKSSIFHAAGDIFFADKRIRWIRKELRSSSKRKIGFREVYISRNELQAIYALTREAVGELTYIAKRKSGKEQVMAEQWLPDFQQFMRQLRELKQASEIKTYVVFWPK